MDGKLHTLVYGKISSISANPIEKKPFFHYWPGSYALTVGTYSCNFTCPWCLPEGSTVLTSDGIQAVEDVFPKVMRGENVYAYTHKGHFRKICQVFRHEFRGELVTFKPAYLNQEISATPSHKILVRRKGKLGSVRAGYIRPGDTVLIPVPRKDFGSPSIIDIKKVVLPKLKVMRNRPSTITENTIEEARNLRRRGLSWRQTCRHLGFSDHLRRVLKRNDVRFRAPPELVFEKNAMIRMKCGRHWIPRFIRLDKDFARLVGYYLAEGYVTEGKKRVNTYAMSLVFNEKEEEFIKDASSILEKTFGIRPRIWRDPKYRICYVTVNDSLVALFFKTLYGSSTKHKQLPMEYLFLPREKQKELIVGLFRGDGLSVHFVTNSYDRFYTHERIQVTPQTLRAQIYLILCRLGFIPSQISKELYLCDVRQTERMLRLMTGRTIRLGKHRKKLLGTIDDNYLYLQIKEVRQRPYEGIVYNLEVEEDHTYTTPLVAMSNCQNWDISKVPPSKSGRDYISPARLVELAKKELCQGLSYSFNEPTLLLDHAVDTFPIARRSGLYCNYVSNGYMTIGALKALRDAGMDAIKFDLKGDREVYRQFCNADVGAIWMLERRGGWACTWRS